MNIDYAIVSSPLGWLLVAASNRGLCVVSFGPSAATLESGLARQFPDSILRRDDASLTPMVAMLLAYLEGQESRLDLPIDVSATPLQAEVWQALRAIPYGETRSYGEVARAIASPATAQEVAHACVSNPIALVVPCHRVVRADGSLAGYRWGAGRKRRLLQREGAAVAA